MRQTLCDGYLVIFALALVMSISIRKLMIDMAFCISLLAKAIKNTFAS